MTFQLFLCIILEEIFGDVANIIDETEIGIGFINPYRYRGYYYDEDTLLYYLQSRYYDPLTGRFINGDEVEYAVTSQENSLKHNIFAYCENQPVSNCDYSGCAKAPIGLYSKPKLAPNLKTQVRTLVFKHIKYDVPLYNQGKLLLCWAYCQVMMEAFFNRKKWKQKDADKKAKALAIKLNGKKNWNQGAFPTNAGVEFCLKTKYTKIDLLTLYEMLVIYGPLYAEYYNSKGDGHLVIITGVDVLKNKVYTNNPWGIKGTQTYDKFKQEVARTKKMSNQGLQLKYIDTVWRL